MKLILNEIISFHLLHLTKNQILYIYIYFQFGYFSNFSSKLFYQKQKELEFYQNFINHYQFVVNALQYMNKPIST